MLIGIENCIARLLLFPLYPFFDIKLFLSLKELTDFSVVCCFFVVFFSISKFLFDSVACNVWTLQHFYYSFQFHIIEYFNEIMFTHQNSNILAKTSATLFLFVRERKLKMLAKSKQVL